MLNSTEKAGDDLGTHPLVEPNLETESKLAEEIAVLWSAHKGTKAEVQRTREDLKDLRRKLGERLYAMKTLLARSGRGGQWTSYLREHHVPRSTGDRYVQEHEALLSPGATNRPSGAISEPTEAEVSKFVEHLIPKLRKVLTRQQALFDFVCKILVELPGMDGDVTDRAVEIYRPAPEAISDELPHTPMSISA